MAAERSPVGLTLLRSPVCRCLPANHIKLRNPYTSELVPSFIGRIPEAVCTLDLPLLLTTRPHFVPPCLLLPTHTFLLPLSAHGSTLSSVPSAASPYVLDCSYMPSHQHCLVCSCVGGESGGTVFSLDLQTCRIIQSVSLPKSTSPPHHQSFCAYAGLFSAPAKNFPVYSDLQNAGLRAAPLRFVSAAPTSVSCASLHRDPSCPLLFLGTSEGDVVAYDLRFPGTCLQPRPCLSLRGAHNGFISGVRAASGPFLPPHFFFTAGRTDGWVKLFDLRFPFHYSTCKGERGASTEFVDRGNAPYPVEAVQPDPALGVHRKEIFTSSTACQKTLFPAAKNQTSGVVSTSHHSCLYSHRSRSNGGVAGIDLSPDGALLAVAHVRMEMPRDFNEAVEKHCKAIHPHTTIPQDPADGCCASDRVGLPSLQMFEGKGEDEGNDIVLPLAEELKTDGPLGETARWNKEYVGALEKCRGSQWRERKLQRRRSQYRRHWRKVRREGMGRLEGETIIFTISEGLRALKTLTVADGCAFTEVEFSANGKHLLQSGGVSNGTACRFCHTCACCCCCSFCAPASTDESQAEEENLSSVSDVLFTSSYTHPARYTDQGRLTPVNFCCGASTGSTSKQRRRRKRKFDREEVERSEEAERNDEGIESEGHAEIWRPQWRRRPPRHEFSHRAQIANLIQCNRVTLLKSPADGALAFADSCLLKHSISSKNAERPGAEHAHTDNLVHRLSSTSETLQSMSLNDAEKGESFKLNLHFLRSSPQESVAAHSQSDSCDLGGIEPFHSSVPLHLRLYSPSSQLMSRRRQAFWQAETGFHSCVVGGGQRKNTTVHRRRGEMESRKGFSRRWQQQEHTLEKPLSVFASTSAARKCASGSVYGRRCSDQQEHEGQQAALGRRMQRHLPFRRCNPQSSLFLSACGVLHPQWGRYDCYSQPFLCTFWGGLVAGLGGSRVYTGLHLWHPSTGVVLSSAEGPLATRQAVRCVRGHPDLSLGILATGGSLRMHSGAETADLSYPSSTLRGGILRTRASPARIAGRGGGKYFTFNASRHSRVFYPAVTLWSLEHRDGLLESALEDNNNSISGKGSLFVDPSDEE